MITIALHGDLKQFLPDPFTLAVSSVKEAVRLLTAQIDGLYSHLIQRALLGAEYTILVNGVRYLSEDQLDDPLGTGRRVDIVPVISGAGGNIGKLILGVALIATGVFTGGVGFISGSALILAGASLALSGLVGLLNPVKNDATGEENKRSFVFNGSSQISSANQPLPLVFGRGYRGEGITVGSAVISASIRSFYSESDPDDGD